MKSTVRVGTLQYGLRPVADFAAFKDQVQGLVATASDDRCDMLVFPEYFTLQLLSCCDPSQPIEQQIRQVAAWRDDFTALFAELAASAKMHILAGTMPTLGSEGIGGRAARLHNDACFFGPTGRHVVQGKLHMTRFEKEEWFAEPRDKLVVIETVFGRCAVMICYDIEFPELARAAARSGAHLLLVPSCTEDRTGFLRVRYCAQARAIENQLYVVQSSVVGGLPGAPAVSLHYGQASVLTPSDFGFARDGILAEGVPNQESLVVGDLDFAALEDLRKNGTVLPLQDSAASDAFARSIVFEEI